MHISSSAALPEGARVILKMTARDMTRELHDESIVLIQMAYAEAGYPDTKPVWDEKLHMYVNEPSVPDAVCQRARMLVAQALGLPYEVVLG